MEVTEKEENKLEHGKFEKLLYAVVRWFFHLIHKDLSDETYDGIVQFIKFGIVGISNTMISYVLYVVSLLVFQQAGILKSYDYLVASVIAFVLSVLWSFYWNNRMVFTVKEGEQRSVWRALIKTYVSYSFTGLFLNSILLVLWVKVLHISEFIAPIINLLISVPINFLINKFWAFKSEKN